MPPDVQKFALLISEIHTRWPQLSKDIQADAKVEAVQALMRKHGLDTKEYEALMLEALERHVQVLRTLPNQ